MRSWFEGNLRLRLAGAEVQVIEVVGDGLVERWQLGVDQQVMMTRIGALQAGRRDPHLVQAESDGDFCRNSGAILETNEINRSSFRRGRRTASSPLLGRSHTACGDTYDQ
jgi:hypothetical protein